MNLDEALAFGAGILKSAGIRNAWGESLLILSYITGLTREHVLAQSGRELSQEEEKIYEENIKKRAERFPLQYIVKNVEFYSLNFYIEEGVFIPRQETEILVEGAYDIMMKNKIRDFVEIGAGSGAVAISLLKLLEDAKAVCTDISRKAIHILTVNSKRHNVIQRMKIIMADLLKPFKDSSLSLIIFNPPYVGLGDEVDKEVFYEPERAIFGGERGVEVIFRFLEEASSVLKPHGWVIFEIGDDQVELITPFMKEKFNDFYTLKDYSGKERVIAGRK